MVFRGLRYPAAFLAPSVCLLSSIFPIVASAQPAAAAEAHATAANSAEGADSSNQMAPSWIVRDPASGRLYRQQVVNVTVPTVQWETKAVTQTVYDAQLVTKNYPQPQTVYVPNTQTVMQPRLRGVWNPFRPPTMTYEFKPQTTWVAQSVTVNTPVTTQQWVPRQQTVYVPQPVQKLQTQQQLVQTEIPQPGTGIPLSSVASGRPPILRVPVLAQQRMLPWAPLGSNQSYPAVTVASNVATPPTTPAVLPPPLHWNSGARPLAIAAQPLSGLRSQNYSAPLRMASGHSTASHRDATQAGMSATVLR